MKIAIVNGSPKAKGSASEAYAAELDRLLGGRAETLLFQWNKPQAKPREVEALAACDAAVLVFPLYVDGIPSHLLRILAELEGHFRGAEAGTKPRIYAIINCGFFEGDQNALCLEMLRHWCARAGLPWGMGVGIGGGPMLSQLPMPLGKGPRKNLGRAYAALAEALLSGGSGGDQFVCANFPRRLYIGIAHTGWRLEAKRNGLKKRDLYRRADCGRTARPTQ